MKRWLAEDWQFEIITTSGIATECRIGIEQGDRFMFQYETPANFCPRAMIEIFTWCEVIRCGGDFSYRGGSEKYELELWCPCHVLQFRLIARPINRDSSGNYIGQTQP